MPRDEASDSGLKPALRGSIRGYGRAVRKSGFRISGNVPPRPLCALQRRSFRQLPSIPHPWGSVALRAKQKDAVPPLP